MKYRVILADDSDVDLPYTRPMFERTGLEVSIEACETADDAFAVLDNGRPVSLLLLDINMPAMDGFELLEVLQNRPRVPPPVVVLSSSPSPKDESKARRHPLVCDYLTKPVMPDQLSAMMRRLGLS